MPIAIDPRLGGRGRDRARRWEGGPESGPWALFFSGGTALRELSLELARLSHNTIHLVTPFDSGGSSAVLRQAFAMPAVGDARNRLLALADLTCEACCAVYALLSRRLSRQTDTADLRDLLEAVVTGSDPMTQAVAEPDRRVVQDRLRIVLDAMPPEFDLAGASLGNLVMAGEYLRAGRRLAPAIDLVAGLVKTRGLVRTVVDKDLTLAARLEDDTVLAGQHLITGKQAPAIASPVKDVFLCASQSDERPVRVDLDPACAALIASADMICYPMGSFYTSLAANLLPLGVGDAVAQCLGPKVYIPSPAGDPEQLGLGLGESVARLVGYLRGSCREEKPVSALLDAVLLDPTPGTYPEPLELPRIAALGVEVVWGKLKEEKSSRVFDGRSVVDNLFVPA